MVVSTSQTPSQDSSLERSPEYTPSSTDPEAYTLNQAPDWRSWWGSRLTETQSASMSSSRRVKREMIPPGSLSKLRTPTNSASSSYAIWNVVRSEPATPSIGSLCRK